MSSDNASRVDVDTGAGQMGWAGVGGGGGFWGEVGGLWKPSISGLGKVYLNPSHLTL